MRRGPTESFMDGKDQVLGFSFNNAQVGVTDGNLRHEFQSFSTPLSVRWDVSPKLATLSEPVRAAAAWASFLGRCPEAFGRSSHDPSVRASFQPGTGRPATWAPA
jgi:hypothetical protein